jgi:hypothetical protein
MNDVAAAFPWIPHAAHSGFSILQPDAPSSGILEATGLDRGRIKGSLKTIFSRDLGALGPLPPTRLMLRVTGIESGDFFRADGLEAFFRPDDSQSANGLESSTWSSFGTPASGISGTSWY